MPLIGVEGLEGGLRVVGGLVVQWLQPQLSVMTEISYKGRFSPENPAGDLDLCPVHVVVHDLENLLAERDLRRVWLVRVNSRHGKL